MKNNKGITLIELLAALALLGIVSSLLYGVMFGASKNYSMLSSKSDLSSEANIILATIKNYHETTVSNGHTYEILLEPSSRQYFIGEKGAAATPLHKQNLKVKIWEVKKSSDGNGDETESEIAGEKVISTLAPFHLKLRVEDSTGQSYEIKTIIKKY